MEGGVRKRNNSFNHLLYTVQNFLRPYVQHAIAILFQELIAHRIERGPLRNIMRLTVNLDHQSRRDDIEIRHIGTDRMLSPHFHARLSAAQALP